MAVAAVAFLPTAFLPLNFVKVSHEISVRLLALDPARLLE
jgi:hypothetical protein